MMPLSEKGFSLVELLVAMVIGGIVAAAILGMFVSQNRSYVAQENVTDMQQNIRAGLGFMTREIRMAGYDPSNSGTVVFFPAGTAPSLSSISFQIDINGDGDALDANEQIRYSLNAAGTLLRLSSATAVVPQPVAEGIDALAFAYAFDSNGDGALDRDGGGNIIYAIAGSDGLGPFDAAINWYELDGTDTTILAQRADIRAVRIWLLAGSGAPDPNYTNSETYTVGTEDLTFNDDRRRRVLDTVVRCRNMGI